MNKDIKLSDLVEGKNVLLVGNSKSLLKKDYSQLIDSYGFVIRFNLSIHHLHKYSIGDKCDAWIYAMCREHVCESTYNSAKNKPKMCVRYGKPLDIGEINITLDVNKVDVINSIGIGEDLHPSTGVVAIWYMLNNATPKSISLIGFDSFKECNFYAAHNSAHLCHSLSAEEKYLTDMHKEGKISFLDH